MGRGELNLASPDSIRAAVRDAKPDVIVNAAAYTAVDKAETEQDLAKAINAIAPGIMAEEAAKLGAALIHYSTDYVFDGTKQGAYTESDAVNPQNVYGATKLAGEKAILDSKCRGLILRTSWVYGARGKNFVLTMLKLAKERSEFKIVSDQRGAPTWCRMIAEATAQILPKFMKEPTGGIYNFTAAGNATWNEFALKIFIEGERLGLINTVPKITPVRTAEYVTPAKRPLNSVLSQEKLKQTFGVCIPDWEIGFGLCMEEIGEKAHRP